MIHQNLYISVRDGIQIDSLSQPFHTDFGLGVDDDSSIPKNFYLSQNYPNPFNPSTKIDYKVSVQGLVSIKIYDVLGNEISTLVNEEKSVGKFEIEFNGKDLPSGIYFYQLNAGNFITTKKMILLKW